MQKKTPKKVKTLRLRKESLKVLTTDEQLQVHGGSDPWEIDSIRVCVA